MSSDTHLTIFIPQGYTAGPDWLCGPPALVSPEVIAHDEGLCHETIYAFSQGLRSASLPICAVVFHIKLNRLPSGLAPDRADVDTFWSVALVNCVHAVA